MLIIKGIKGEFYPCKPDIFALTYDEATKTEARPGKSLHNTTANGAKKNVKDIQFWGDGDTFRLISKASSESEGWMKSTKAMPAGNSVVVQVTTQQRNPDGSYNSAPMPFAVRVNAGVFTHAGNTTGDPESHGCIRLPLHYAM